MNKGIEIIDYDGMGNYSRIGNTNTTIQSSPQSKFKSIWRFWKDKRRYLKV